LLCTWTTPTTLMVTSWPLLKLDLSLTISSIKLKLLASSYCHFFWVMTNE
jgi:hypothetical protein